MADKEKEIRLQFLDEATEYLDTLESTLLGVAQRGVDTHEINAALRAAHSIKGGAALMGYGMTSDLAHRLEDSLKVLKIQKGAGLTADVETKLLGGVDSIRQIVERDRTNQPVDDYWVNSTVLPIFDSLKAILGEPTAEDAASIMETDEGQDVMPLIFQTEVESSLERLEVLLEEPPENLQEEIVVMAQELSGLGEMLALPPFISLCQSVEQTAINAANPQQLMNVGHSALTTWRRAQALVITGNADSMPTSLENVGDGVIDFGTIDFEFDEPGRAQADSSLGDAADAPLADSVFADLSDGQVPLPDGPLTSEDMRSLGEEDDALVADIFAGLGEEDDALVADVFSTGAEPNVDSATDQDGQPVSELDMAPAIESPTDEASAESIDAFAGVFDTPEVPGQQDERAAPSGTTEFRFSEAPKAQPDAPDLSDNTVRVSVRKLNDLNDYLGELTIERNRLEAEIKQMRGLVKDMGRKLRSLDEINDDVKDLYEMPSAQRLLTGAPSSSTNGERPAGENGNQSGDRADSSASTAGGQRLFQSGLPEFRQDFDTLEFDRYNDAHLPFRQIVESVVKLQEVADDIELSVDKAEQTTRVIHRTARHLQRNLNQLRMRPLSDITNRFPRALRELEIEHGKSVALRLEGESTLIDRNILESLSDPMMHIVRNAFDHGIEVPQAREAQGKPAQGTISIQAFNRSNRTIINISDDGTGISLDKIRDRAQSMGLDADLLSAATEAELLSLIFEPGFTTSDEVTSLSGRGVGMDVVRNNLTQIRGDISVDTHPGEGTTFTISVPYTLSVTRIMLAEGSRMPVALPTDMIEEVTVLQPSDMYETDGKDMFHFKGDAVRLIRLSNWMSFNCPRQIDSLEDPPKIDGPSVLIFRMGEQRVGLQVDRSWGEQEVAVRRVEGPIALPAGFSNCTILGDGRVVPLVSLTDFARWVFNCEGSDIHSAEALYSNPVVNGGLDPVSLQTLPAPSARRPRFMVIDDSVNVRRLLALTLEKKGYEVVQARDGQDALDKLEADGEIDSIVCDVEMPRMDGYSFLSKLRSHPNPKFSHLPVTMLTSRSGEKHRNLAINLGATAYFSKPYQERVLLKSLAETLPKTRTGQTAETAETAAVDS